MYTWLRNANSLRTSERLLKFHQQRVKPIQDTSEKTDEESAD